MSNFYGSERSNYFRVKNEEAFLAWAKKRDLHTVAKAGCFSVYPENSEDGCFPSYNPDAPEDEQEFDVLEEIADHLADNSVALIIGCGAEKLRYINGFARAINAKGEQVSINLDEIYERAAKLGGEVERAEY